MGKKTGRALVVGAGISGIRAALDLAETGYGVTLIDRSAHMGGILSQLDYQFPTNHCGMCKMLPLIQRDQSSQFCLRKGLFHANIDILLNTQICVVDGEPGNFSVSLKQKPTWIDPELCIGCGVCVDVCPVEVPDEFNQGLSRRKAIYLPVPHNIPNPYVIDLSACTDCGECEKVCPTSAIQLAYEKRKQFHILVVDDELIVRDSLKEWLVEEGFAVDFASSGAQALEKLGQTQFNLMLTDIKMPAMDGVELLKLAKELHPDLCVLMMTAYATVETAVEAMKIGARDYLMKPFDPDDMISKVVAVYEELQAGALTTLEVGSIVFCGGTDYYNPTEGKNVYGYGINPNVVTSLELERIFSGTGPSRGRLVRPSDGKPIRKIAWLQCVGSRDIQCEADFCSSICCMFAIKEALLAKHIGGVSVETALFYMDMRTFGKSFQRYRDSAETEQQIRFERARIHSVSPDPETGNPALRYVRTDGEVENETFDLVVLSVGQRPLADNEEMADLVGCGLNAHGFVATEPFKPAITAKPGVVVGGSHSGLKDISESVIYASAASIEASRTIHAAGGSLAVETKSEVQYQDVSRETPRVLVAICTCGARLSHQVDMDMLKQRLEEDPVVDQVVFTEHFCTQTGWEELAAIAEEQGPNRILLGGCHPYLFTAKLRELGRRLLLDPALLDAVDIMSPRFAYLTSGQAAESDDNGSDATDAPVEPVFLDPSQALTALEMGLANLKHVDPQPVATLPVQRRALVVGGGIAGMHAALAVADHGYPVDLIERQEELGGNLRWLHETIEGHPITSLLAETIENVQKHPRIALHMGATIDGSFGEVGDFYTTITENGGALKTIQHGTVILAVGGGEAIPDSYGFGQHAGVITQKGLETRLAGKDPALQELDSVVMIQCVESRQEPRNYCSRVCCPTSLKHALKLKEANPDLAVYIFYRDMMTPGFSESYFTKARQAGVIFIQYEPQTKPQVNLPQNGAEPLIVAAVDPLLGRPVEISADLLVLAPGIIPELSAQLAEIFGAKQDQDCFFQEADPKWRPVDALKEGVFACGITLAPRSIPDSIATAGAAAQRALRILSHERLPAGKIVATVRHSICSLCERCIETCPYGARSLDGNNDRIMVNPAMCQGCGDCASVCPNSAAVVQGFGDKKVMEMLASALM
jgi:heterodisulfide reductase subunit A